MKTDVLVLIRSASTYVFVENNYMDVPSYLELAQLLVGHFFFQPNILLFFLFLHENISYVCFLQLPCQGYSDVYPLTTTKEKLIKNQ